MDLGTAFKFDNKPMNSMENIVGDLCFAAWYR